jgi:3-oxoacyl-[acyl-carrier-protein] synthase I
MPGSQPVEVLAVGVVTPVGLTAGASAAAVRAGVCRIRQTAFYDRKLKPVVAGFLDDEHLMELPMPLRHVTRAATVRHQRMLRLAGPALREAARGCPVPPPLLLALPEPLPGSGDPLGPDFVESLVQLSQVPIDTRQSQLFRLGRAGGLIALERALHLLRSGHSRYVLVGGVDSWVEAALFAWLEEQGRLHGEGLSDGLVTGEGAAFLLLGAVTTAWPEPQPKRVQVLGVGTGHEEGHRYGEKPYRGEGLSQAFQRLFDSLPQPVPRIRTVYAGLNGESFWSKEWGVAYLRHARYFEDPLRVEHPVELIGDPGAALGPLLVALAVLGIQKGYREAPCLVWCSSDWEARGAAILQAATP